MGLQIDWKFIVGSLLTIAGLGVSLYVWQVDPRSPSLSIRLVSSNALQPESSAQFQDLQVTLNGAKITSPYLSSFEMVNTGSKPILSSDFESPIEIEGIGSVQLISTQVTGTDPKDIPARISLESNHIKISPFLSNPNDVVSFSVITGTEPPKFKAKARIAGVKELVLEDSSTKKGRLSTILFGLPLSIIALVLYMRFALAALFEPVAFIRRPTSIFTSLICCIAAATLFTKAIIELGFYIEFMNTARVQFASYVVVGLFVWGPFMKAWRKERSERLSRTP